MSKVMSYGHLCQIYQNHPPNMVMSRDPGFNFRKFFFLAYFCIKFWGNWLKNKKVIGRKPIGGGKHPPSAYRVKFLKYGPEVVMISPNVLDIREYSKHILHRVVNRQ